MLFFRQHFHKQRQAEIWFKIITILVTKRSEEKTKHCEWKNCWVEERALLPKNPNITNKKQCLPSLEKTLHELPPNPSFLQENLDHPSSKGDLTLCKLFKSNKRQTYNDLLCSKRIQLRSRNVHPFFSCSVYE